MKATTNSYRFWSPQRVGDELEYLVETYGVRNVKFADEMFVLNKRHVEGICDEIINRHSVIAFRPEYLSRLFQRPRLVETARSSPPFSCILNHLVQNSFTMATAAIYNQTVHN